MSVIRAFIAVEIPPEIRQEIGALELRIQQRASEAARRAVRWVPAANMHLTLKFLGDISPASVEPIAQMLQNEAARCKPFTVRLGGLGAFPNQRRPRVLWLGVDAPQSLYALQRAVEAGARQLGYPLEERAFSPHLTLGRVHQNATPAEVALVAQALDGQPAAAFGRLPVDALCLFQSDLRPEGALYTCLARAALSAGGG